MRRFGLLALSLLVVGCAGRAPRAPAEPLPDHMRAGGRWLRIITTNDFHGALEPRRDSSGILRGGAVALAGIIGRARAECQAPVCRSILLDGGDMFQGTPASNFAFGKPVVELYNLLGYTAAALGNHEFDWGQDSLRARLRDAKFAVLGANVTDTLGRDSPWIANDTIVSLGDLRVGVMGFSTVATPTTTRPSNVRDLKFLALPGVADARARSLRARGAQVVIAIAHAGAFCDRSGQPGCRGEIVDLAEQATERIDAIVSGHTHSAVRTVVRGTPIVQAYSRGSAVGIIDLPLGDSSMAPQVAIRDVFTDSTTPPNPRVAAIVRAAAEPVERRMSQPVVQIAERMSMGIRGTLGALIADAQRDAGRGDVAVMNNGGIRSALDAGMVTFGSLFEVHPFGNTLVRITVTGRDLRAYLERLVGRAELNAHVSGVTITYDPRRPVGSRINAVRVADGRPLDEAARYVLVITDFLAAGGDGLGVTERAVSVEELAITDLDALVAYLRKQPSPVRAPDARRIIANTP
jgi:2',3'-cyclic-nucleotide 2'-phosphodiesterase (5'-nucleotidase family)